MWFVNVCVHACTFTNLPSMCNSAPQSEKSEHASVCLWSDTQRMIAQSTWKENLPIADFLTIFCVLCSCWGYTIRIHLVPSVSSSKSFDSIIMFISPFSLMSANKDTKASPPGELGLSTTAVGCPPQGTDFTLFVTVSHVLWWILCWCCVCACCAC